MRHFSSSVFWLLLATATLAALNKLPHTTGLCTETDWGCKLKINLPVRRATHTWRESTKTLSPYWTHWIQKNTGRKIKSLSKAYVCTDTRATGETMSILAVYFVYIQYTLHQWPMDSKRTCPIMRTLDEKLSWECVSFSVISPIYRFTSKKKRKKV